MLVRGALLKRVGKAAMVNPNTVLSSSPPGRSLRLRQLSSPRLQRLLRRRSERGMAVFLVVLVLTMITAIGVFSMHSASLVDRASGFHRQNVQATAMVEFAARGAATWILPNRSQVAVAANRITPIRQANCAPQLLAADALASCWAIPDDALAGQFVDTAPTPFEDDLHGQLSPPRDAASAAIRAEFSTEVTEAFNANAAARAGNSGNLVELTFTTRSRIYPTDASIADACTAAARGAVSQQSLRSHVLVQF